MNTASPIAKLHLAIVLLLSLYNKIQAGEREREGGVEELEKEEEEEEDVKKGGWGKWGRGRAGAGAGVLKDSRLHMRELVFSGNSRIVYAHQLLSL